MSSQLEDVTFQEEQRFRQWWLLAALLLQLVVLCGLAAWFLLRQFVLHSGQDSSDAMPDSVAVLISAVCVVSGLIAPALMWMLRLQIAVAADGVHVRFWPLPGRVITYGQIADCYPRTYRPIAEYGGWGIRWGRSGQAYNVSGNEGVQLELVNGKRVLLGSQRAPELAEAIAAHLQPSGA